MKGKQYMLHLPEDMEEFPCLPLPCSKNKITSIPRNAILTFHAVQRFGFASAAVFEIGKGQLVFISLEAADEYCFKINKR